MKGLAWIVLLVLICLCAYNLWATHKLKGHVHQITTALASEGRIEITPPAFPKIKKLIGEASAHLSKAQEALVEGNPDDSKLHLELALEKVEQAKKLGEEKLGGEGGLMGDIKDVATQIKDTIVKNWPKSDEEKSNE